MSLHRTRAAVTRDVGCGAHSAYGRRDREDPRNNDPRNNDPRNNDPRNNDPRNNDPRRRGRALPPKIGRYIVLETIGIGGMGVVCTAYDPKLDRKVALKLLRRASNRRRAETSQARLVREAQALAKLTHPNIVTVHDVDTYQGRLYIAMEYVEGTGLDVWLDAERRSYSEILDVFMSAGRGLAAAHAAGITHRDFKPGNVQVGRDGRVRVLDFGLAKNAEDADPSLEPGGGAPEQARAEPAIMDLVGATADLKLTQAGRTVGTPSYMAPEQFRGLPVGPKSDQFAFGVALFEALFLRLPFGDPDEDDFVDRVCDGTFGETPSGSVVPAWITRVVLRMLAADERARYASMEEALAALQSDPARRRQRWLFGAGLTGLVGLSGYGAVGLLAGTQTPCSGAVQRLGELWTARTRARVHEAFASTQAPFAAHAWRRTEELVDNWTQRWVGHHSAVCLASARGEQSDALMDLRMACLDRGRAELAGLVAVFAEADAAVVQRAVAAAQGLSDIDRCATALPALVGALPDNREDAATAQEIERRRAEAAANVLAGRYEAALALAQGAQRDAARLDHTPTLARAEDTLGIAYHHVARPQEAAAHLTMAVRLSARAGMPEVEAGAWSMLLYVEADPLERHTDALAKRLAAETALERAGAPAKASANLAAALGAALTRADRPKEALEQDQRAVDLWRSVGERSDGLGAALNNLGVALAKRGRMPEAKAALQEALSIRRELVGPRHPRVASLLFNLGHVLRGLEQTGEARAAYLESLEVVAAVYGGEHPAMVGALVGLARVQETDDRGAAIAAVHRAVSILKQSAAPRRRLLIAQTTLTAMRTRAGQSAADAGDTTLAIRIWTGARAETQAIVGRMSQVNPSRDRALAQAQLCALSARLSDTEQGPAQCEAALAQYADLGGEVGEDEVGVLLDYARVLPEPRARERLVLADVALRWHRDHGNAADELETLRWVAELRRLEPDTDDVLTQHVLSVPALAAAVRVVGADAAD